MCGHSVLGAAGVRSVPTTWEEIGRAKPDVIISAPCGFGLGDSIRLARQLVTRRLLPAGIPV